MGTKEAKLEELDKLIAESEAAIKSIETAQRRGPTQLQHQLQPLRKHGSTILLAASVFVVALGRAVQKQKQEEEVASWEEERRRLTVERNRLQEQLHATQLSTENLVRQIEAAAAAGKRNLAGEVQGVLQSYRDAQQQMQGQLSPAVAALLHAAQAAQQPKPAAGDGAEG